MQVRIQEPVKKFSTDQRPVAAGFFFYGYQMKKLLLSTILSAISFGAFSAAPEIIFYGGEIITMDKKTENAEAVSLRNGRIEAVGKLDQLKKASDQNTKMVNLQGKTLMPGFVDAHLHVIATALCENVYLNLSNFELPYDTLDSLVAKLKKYNDSLPEGSWVIAFGVDPSRTSPFMAELDADTLDKVSTKNPILVINQSGHLAYANRKAFEIAGVTDATPNPAGGSYGRDSNGKLNGKIYEPPVIATIMAKAPKPTDAQMAEAFKRTGQMLSRAGVTTTTDMSVGMFLGLEKEYELLKELVHKGVINSRVRGYIYSAVYPNDSTKFKPNMGNEMFKLIGIKIVSDGSDQGLTGAFNTPYLFPAHTHNSGKLNYTNEEFFNMAKPRFDEGWQISTHANGDRAIDQTLQVYERLVQNPNDAKTRLRVEHFTVPSKKNIETVNKLGATVSFTIGHSDFWGEAFHNHLLGPERGNNVDPSNSLLKAGVVFSYHSDSPVSPIAPLTYVSQGSSRLWQAKPQKVLNPNERISVYDALKAVTINPAYQLKMENEIGSITEGKFADLVVLDKNPLKTEPYEIRSIKVLETWVNGKKVH